MPFPAAPFCAPWSWLISSLIYHCIISAQPSILLWLRLSWSHWHLTNIAVGDMKENYQLPKAISLDKRTSREAICKHYRLEVMYSLESAWAENDLKTFMRTSSAEIDNHLASMNHRREPIENERSCWRGGDDEQKPKRRPKKSSEPEMNFAHASRNAVPFILLSLMQPIIIRPAPSREWRRWDDEIAHLTCIVVTSSLII